VQGTEQYLPPEVRAKKQNSLSADYDPKKCDIFTLGVILFILAYGQMPFTKATIECKYYRHFYFQNLAGYITEHPGTRYRALDEDLVFAFVSMM
jgi:serine/threonine protein kinase